VQTEYSQKENPELFDGTENQGIAPKELAHWHIFSFSHLF